MKFSKYFMMAGTAFMLAACSSEEPVPAPGSEFADIQNVDTYAMFEINLASNGGTRATTFVDGEDEDEYKVDNGKILLFGLPNDGDETTTAGRIQAKFIVAADLTMTPSAVEGGEYDAKNTGVKAKFKKGTFSIASYKKYYAVCILNSPASWTPEIGQTFEEWAKATDIDDNLKNSQGHFIMTNAPTYRNGDPTVLPEINRTHIKDNESEVTTAAASITVQRVAAKVTLANAVENGTTSFTVADGEYKDGKATIVGWDMDLTRKTTYPIQIVFGNVAEFFTATSPAWFHSGTDFQRCNWGDSKFYTTTMTAAQCAQNFGRYGDLDMDEASKYIRENTMAYNKMSKGQTTRMVVKAKFQPKDIDANTTFVKIGTRTELYTAATLKTEIENVCKTQLGMIDPVATVDFGDASGYVCLDDILDVTAKDAEGGQAKDITESQWKDLAGLMGVYEWHGNEVAVYTNGECYYTVYIRHFDDEDDDSIKASNILTLGQYTKAHTGRYGIMRNNWYEITVNSISGPGVPSVPDPDPETPVDAPDDDGVRHMQVSLNILNWAKHTQGVDL